MNKKQKIVLGIGALSLLVFAGASSQIEAYRGDPSIKGPNYSEERHEAMQKAFEANDYASWKNLMDGRGRVTQVVNEKNFAKFAEAHNLALKGDISGAQKIRQDLGLGLKDGKGQGMRNGFGVGMNKGMNQNR